MKAVSSIIAIILILMIIIALVAMLWLFMSTLFGTTSASTSQSLGKTALRMSGCVRMENFDAKIKNITLRNCGSTTLDSFNFYSDSKLITTYSGTVNPGETFSFNLDIPQGDHTLYVTTSSAQSLTKKVSITGTCTGVQPPTSGDWTINGDTSCTCRPGENITIIGKVWISGTATFSINGCHLIISTTSDPALTASGSTKVNIINSIFNISDPHSAEFYNSMNYIENSILDGCQSGCNFGGGSKTTMKNSQVIFDAQDHYVHINGANTEMTFYNSFINKWHMGDAVTGTSIVRGNLSLRTIGEWYAEVSVQRIYPVIIKDTLGNPTSATVNITRAGGSSIWGPQSAPAGYAEPSIVFGSTNYSSTSFTLYVYNGVKTNSTIINFLNNTPIILTL